MSLVTLHELIHKYTFDDILTELTEELKLSFADNKVRLSEELYEAFLSIDITDKENKKLGCEYILMSNRGYDLLHLYDKETNMYTPIMDMSVCDMLLGGFDMKGSEVDELGSLSIAMLLFNLSESIDEIEIYKSYEKLNKLMDKVKQDINTSFTLLLTNEDIVSSNSTIDNSITAQSKQSDLVLDEEYSLDIDLNLNLHLKEDTTEQNFGELMEVNQNIEFIDYTDDYNDNDQDETSATELSISSDYLEGMDSAEKTILETDNTENIEDKRSKDDELYLLNDLLGEDSELLVEEEEVYPIEVISESPVFGSDNNSNNIDLNSLLSDEDYMDQEQISHDEPNEKHIDNSIDNMEEEIIEEITNNIVDDAQEEEINLNEIEINEMEDDNIYQDINMNLDNTIEDKINIDISYINSDNSEDINIDDIDIEDIDIDIDDIDIEDIDIEDIDIDIDDIDIDDIDIDDIDDIDIDDSIVDHKPVEQDKVYAQEIDDEFILSNLEKSFINEDIIANHEDKEESLSLEEYNVNQEENNKIENLSNKIKSMTKSQSELHIDLHSNNKIDNADNDTENNISEKSSLEDSNLIEYDFSNHDYKNNISKLNEDTLNDTISITQTMDFDDTEYHLDNMVNEQDDTENRLTADIILSEDKNDAQKGTLNFLEYLVKADRIAKNEEIKKASAQAIDIEEDSIPDAMANTLTDNINEENINIASKYISDSQTKNETDDDDKYASFVNEDAFSDIDDDISKSILKEKHRLEALKKRASQYTSGTYKPTWYWDMQQKERQMRKDILRELRLNPDFLNIIVGNHDEFEDEDVSENSFDPLANKIDVSVSHDPVDYNITASPVAGLQRKILSRKHSKL